MTPSQLNEAADVIRNIGDLDRRRLPQFPLRKSQRLEARLSTGQPLLQKGTFVCRHGDPKLRLAYRVLWFRRVIRGRLIAQQPFDLLVGKRFQVHLLGGC